MKVNDDPKKLKKYLEDMRLAEIEAKEEIREDDSHYEDYDKGYESGVLEGHLQMMQLIGTLNDSQIKTISQVVRSSFIAGLESQ